MLRKKKYYSLDRIDATDAKYRMIFGERSNGKSYAVLYRIIENYTKTGKQGAYIRRWDTDFKGSRGRNIFEGLVANNVVSKLTNFKWDSIKYNSGSWYLAKWDDELNKYVTDETPFCYALAINETEHTKSVSFPNVSIICFDEFIAMSGRYLIDEFVLFCNLLSTIIRDRDDVVIYMLGNTVSRYSIYFSEMGLKHVKNMKPDSIDIYNYKDGLTVAVEYTGTSKKHSKASDIYFAFDNPKLQMITGGDWEISPYPHLPEKYKKSQVRYAFFIEWDNELFQCDIVEGESDYFIFIMPKTTDIKNNTDLLYSVRIDSNPYHLRSVYKSTNKKTSVISKMFKNNQVFYLDNNVGDTINTYLEWCKREG